MAGSRVRMGSAKDEARASRRERNRVPWKDGRPMSDASKGVSLVSNATFLLLQTHAQDWVRQYAGSAWAIATRRSGSSDARMEAYRKQLCKVETFGADDIRDTAALLRERMPSVPRIYQEALIVYAHCRKQDRGLRPKTMPQFASFVHEFLMSTSRQPGTVSGAVLQKQTECALVAQNASILALQSCLDRTERVDLASRVQPSTPGSVCVSERRASASVVQRPASDLGSRNADEKVARSRSSQLPSSSPSARTAALRAVSSAVVSSRRVSSSAGGVALPSKGTHRPGTDSRSEADTVRSSGVHSKVRPSGLRSSGVHSKVRPSGLRSSGLRSEVRSSRRSSGLRYEAGSSRRPPSGVQSELYSARPSRLRSSAGHRHSALVSSVVSRADTARPEDLQPAAELGMQPSGFTSPSALRAELTQGPAPDTVFSSDVDGSAPVPFLARTGRSLESVTNLLPSRSSGVGSSRHRARARARTKSAGAGHGVSTVAEATDDEEEDDAEDEDDVESGETSL